MTVIGITGTDGKTTTTNIIYHILKNAGKEVAMISTVEAIIDGKSFDTGFHVTTPSPWNLQKFLRKAVDSGSKYFVLEVTSHALDQNRVFGASIDIALITNISHEHLDYHRTLSSYRETKSKILNGAKYSVLNHDENNFSYLKHVASGSIVTFGIDKNADYSDNNTKIKPKIPGKFNYYNCLAAFAVAKIIRIDSKVIRRAISSFEGVCGRMEEVRLNKPFKVYIDFAHKPNALEQVLLTARKMAKNKVIVVFGCAGLRDRLKRPMMGEIAARLSDYIVLTAEDPRTEDVREIISQIALGIPQSISEGNKKMKEISYLKKNKKYYWRIPDRQEAINFAIRNLARSGDLILITGKGHEKSMCYGRTEYPWDEKKAIEKASSTLH